MGKYILITPVKNEIIFLPIFAKCIIEQTIRPILWIIVDGDSNDGTIDYIKQLSNKYKWIYYKKQSLFVDKQNHKNFSIAVWEGYEYVEEISKIKNINYKYVAKMDVDVIINNNFFEILIDNFEHYPQLGIASGITYNLSNYDIIDKNNISKYSFKKTNFLPFELPDKRLYRKQYLDGVGGFPLSDYSPDTVLLTKFRINKFHVKSFENAPIYNLREDTGTYRDIMKSSYIYGKNRYYLNYHPLLIFFIFLYMSVHYPFYQAIYFFAGYISSIINKNEKINDGCIKKYFYNERIKEIFYYILNYKI